MSGDPPDDLQSGCVDDELLKCMPCGWCCKRSAQSAEASYSLLVVLSTV